MYGDFSGVGGVFVGAIKEALAISVAGMGDAGIVRMADVAVGGNLFPGRVCCVFPCAGMVMVFESKKAVSGMRVVFWRDVVIYERCPQPS